MQKNSILTIIITLVVLTFVVYCFISFELVPKNEFLSDSITYQNLQYNFSFTLPRNTSPLTVSKNGKNIAIITSQEANAVIRDVATIEMTSQMLQFSLPSYIPEGSELIPFVQIEVDRNEGVVQDSNTQQLTLSDYVRINEKNVFIGEVKSSKEIINGQDQIIICEKDIPANCAFYQFTKDGQHVIKGMLVYPVQGRRSQKTDPALEAAFRKMRTSIEVLFF